MPTSRVRCDYEQLKQIQQAFTQRAESLASMNRNIRARKDTLQQGKWVGDSADKFYQEMDGAILPALDRLQQALVSASETTRKTLQLLHQAEEEAARILGESGNGGAAEAVLPSNGNGRAGLASTRAKVPSEVQQGPTPTPPPQAGPGSGKNNVYTLQPGETLMQIALKNNIPYAELVAANRAVFGPNFNPLTVGPGQQIVIPNPGQSAPAIPSNNTYNIQPGDTWLSIAARYGIPLSELYRANNVVNPSLMPPVGTPIYLIDWPAVPPQITPHSQYDSSVTSSSGFYACGLVSGSAAAEALGLNYAAVLAQFQASAAQYGYNNDTGIQPTNYFNLTQSVLQQFGATTQVINTPDQNNSAAALEAMRQQLVNGNQVVVDLVAVHESGSLGTVPAAPGTPDSFSHFARVVGFSPDGQTVYLSESLYAGDSTLSGSTTDVAGQQDAVVAVPVGTFVQAWYNPEVNADVNGPTREQVGYWMMSISPPATSPQTPTPTAQP